MNPTIQVNIKEYILMNLIINLIFNFFAKVAFQPIKQSGICK